MTQQVYFAVFLSDVPDDDWRRARGLSRDRYTAECMAERYPGARVVEVKIETVSNPKTKRRFL